MATMMKNTPIETSKVFVYRHTDTGEIRALYLDDAFCLSGRTDWTHVATLEPRAWIEANWRNAVAVPDLLAAMQACHEAMSYMSEYDIPITLPEQVRAAIQKATGEAV